MSDVCTIQTALEWIVSYLEKKQDENPLLSAQWLLSEATGLTRIELYTKYDMTLSMSERDTLREYVSRRAAGEPLQYITGEVGFRYITLKVCPGVLIPRPETEVLVSEALATLPPKEKASLGFGEASCPDADEVSTQYTRDVSSQDASEEPSRDASRPATDKTFVVVDLCTGSGCVACSIAHEYPLARVLATDIDSTAIELAKTNIERLGLSSRVKTSLGDVGDAVPSEMLGSIDLVVSNPPYIPTSLLEEIPHEVTAFEPHLALDGGDDGLLVFRKILDWSWHALKQGGSLVVELHEDCLQQAAGIAQERGFTSNRVVRDLAGRDRILIAKKL